MKVIEIIKTDQLNEVNLLTRTASFLLGKPLNYVLSVIGKGSAGRGMEELISHVDRSGKLNMNAIKASYGKVFADDLARNTKLVTKIEKSAASASRTAQFSKNIAEVKAVMSSIKSAGSTILKGLEGLSKLALGYTIIDPWLDYLSIMDDVEEKVDSGEYTIDDLAQLRKKELGILIGRLTMAFGSLVVGGSGGWVIKKILPNGLSPLVDKLTPVGIAYFINLLNSPANANAIATLMVQPIAAGISAADVAGNLYLKAEGMLKTAEQKQEGDATTQAAPISPTSGTAATPSQVKSTTSTQTAQPVAPEQPAEPAAPALDRSKWEYYTPGYIRNPETGEIVSK